MDGPLLRIERLGECVGQSVRLRGWVYRNRPSGKVAFLMVRDGSGLCQCVVEKSRVPEELFERVKHAGQETAIEVAGEVRGDERSPGGVELVVSDAVVVGGSEEYPITPKSHGPDFLLRHRHLHLRSQRPWALMRLRHVVIDAIRRYFNDHGFVLIDTPILMATAGEGEQTLFEVDYFGEPVYLAQTGQLYLEAAAMSHGRVYCFGPTFRAEKSKTRRHLTEFWMVEPEIAYTDIDELMATAEGLICAIVERVLADCRGELAVLDREAGALEAIRGPFPRVSYDEAVELLRSERVRSLFEMKMGEAEKRLGQLRYDMERMSEEAAQAKKKWQQEKLAQQLQAARDEVGELEEQLRVLPEHMASAAGFDWGGDLGGSDETILSELYDRPIMVHRYPRGCKAFYMKPQPDRNEVVLNFDCLAPQGYGEIIGGSMREEDHDALLERVRALGYDPGDYQWYLDLRRYGSVPHGGFGLGIERTVAWLAGIRHVREAIAFPRLMGKILP